jgi:prepilin-type N-terminal cleavage/methylation domain-containing protein
MNMNRPDRIRGYTLAELVISIAIIATLMAIFIVSFSSFIRKAHLSHDLNIAKAMTDMIRNHRLIHLDQHLDGHDIKYILSEKNGIHFSYIPKSKNYFFVYNYPEQTVVLKNYYDFERSFDDVFLQMSNHNECFGLTPEELFGEDSYILTSEGSNLALLISDIRALGNHFNLLEQYDNLSKKYISQKSNTPKLIQKLLNDFNPSHTLYANTLKYHTLANEGDQIRHVVFSEKMTNIPPLKVHYDLSNIHHLHLPLRIHSIEREGLTKFHENTKITVANKNLKLQTNAAPYAFASSYETLVLEDYSHLDLMVYDHEYEEAINQNNNLVHINDRLVIQLDAVPIFNYITNVHIIIQNKILIKLYTKQGFKAIIEYEIY